MDLGYRNRVAVVTGGTSGIGLATARLLLAEGARVVICGRDKERLAQAARILGSDERLLALPCNVLDSSAISNLARLVSEWSAGRIDLLVNNAGEGRVSTFAQTSDEAWREELDLKIFSQVLPIRAFKPLLEGAQSPAIVGVNSLLAVQPEPHMVCTSAARASALNLLKSLANEFAPRIRVNSILLGLVDSGQWQRRFDARKDKTQSREDWYADLARQKAIPLQRLGHPEEAAKAILYLGSTAASYITGTSLEVSGGLSRFI